MVGANGVAIGPCILALFKVPALSHTQLTPVRSPAFKVTDVPSQIRSSASLDVGFGFGIGFCVTVTVFKSLVHEDPVVATII